MTGKWDEARVRGGLEYLFRVERYPSAIYGFPVKFVTYGKSSVGEIDVRVNRSAIGFLKICYGDRMGLNGGVRNP